LIKVFFNIIKLWIELIFMPIFKVDI